MIFHSASYAPKTSGKSFVTMASSDEIVSEKQFAPTPRFEAAPKAANKDDLLLAELGYKQEFKREFSVFSCICFAFSISKQVSSAEQAFPTKALTPSPPPHPHPRTPPRSAYCACSGRCRVRLVDG